ncbi:MAG: hypothetical protein A3J55_04180 [Candidatus Ryanbacteria bacterium RIFCSPHIGHO2_02_FULL_45_17b]|uniref:Hydrolase n=1 Tax=Candidatus Ryanbacteria bacterium RIFCSPHIGHO2_01_FULL_45_22 TaxID=1802114 RepID=A0A1G2G2G2_9BACT|nr:MAG: hypothetical protein A2719_02315 [Candidatus Ryanbacteria bacterium RIFCSPHIGHO2_01_FULL_45_22]OGZ46470.1 MAG: hypothetical protein A3J55_04180 [Candidatus Ryanbacteria bacterium RIFCSPHIGHO2_02_FULL_45_17b]
MIEAVIFDFNGVLLQDRKWHEKAWNELSKFLRDKELDQDEFEHYVHGRTPKDTLAYLLGHPASPKELKDYLDNKESLYQKIALSSGDEFQLTPYAKELFKLLDEHDIRKTIATSSPLVNVKFYYQHLDLGRWFPFQDIVFDDGTFPGKPAPDIYVKAAKNIHVDIKNCVVIEDAKSGIESAKKAGAGKIIFIMNDDNQETAKKLNIDKVIRSFNEIKLEDFGE